MEPPARSLALLLLAALSACAPALSGPDACNELADAIEATVNRCGGDGAAAHANFILEAANGNCNTVTSVRDPDGLEGDCLPFLKAVDCMIVNGPNFTASLPEACRAQWDGAP